MIRFLKNIFNSRSKKQNISIIDVTPPYIVFIDDLRKYAIAEHLSTYNGMPYLDWNNAIKWISSYKSKNHKKKAWSECETAWLQHLSKSLGESFYISTDRDALLLSSLKQNVARATMQYINKTLREILKTLNGISKQPEFWRVALIVLDDADSYYDYISYYYSDSDDFPCSAGVYVNAGYGHFVTISHNLSDMEPVIAHEMTHLCIDHLQIPKWLNEGIAVNTQNRLCRTCSSTLSEQEKQKEYKEYWGPKEIQEFWTGQSFERTDDGVRLSYDLAEKIVAYLSRDWKLFCTFVNTAEVSDGGYNAALECFDLELNTLASTILGVDIFPTKFLNSNHLKLVINKDS